MINSLYVIFIFMFVFSLCVCVEGNSIFRMYQHFQFKRDRSWIEFQISLFCNLQNKISDPLVAKRFLDFSSSCLALLAAVDKFAVEIRFFLLLWTCIEKSTVTNVWQMLCIGRLSDQCNAIQQMISICW